ncbi:MAG: hypothetical protein SGI92_21360, partial [Bryobacteraceae bacterium]|nr:hypothetical protein [Bryobacteraceae bacterium]
MTIRHRLADEDAADFQLVTIRNQLADGGAAFTPLHRPHGLRFTEATARGTVKRHECRALGDWERRVHKAPENAWCSSDFFN